MVQQLFGKPLPELVSAAGYPCLWCTHAETAAPQAARHEGLTAVLALKLLHKLVRGHVLERLAGVVLRTCRKREGDSVDRHISELTRRQRQRSGRVKGQGGKKLREVGKSRRVNSGRGGNPRRGGSRGGLKWHGSHQQEETVPSHHDSELRLKVG